MFRPEGGRNMLPSLLAIGVGAALGAILRFYLAVWLNALFPQVPPGTLAANLVGGYLVGVAIAFFIGHPGVPPEWRLFVITGFLGGLTTFSTFSAEVTALLQGGRLLWAMIAIAAHVIGSLVMTLLGFATVGVLRAA
jgi:fluoride exporter